MKKIINSLMGNIFNRRNANETTILLIRHGETDWNAAGRVQGHIDRPLNAVGILQADQLADRIFIQHPDITAFYSSDLQRAYATAQATAQKYNLKVDQKAGLREVSYGVADGMTIQEKIEKYQDAEKHRDEMFLDRKQRWDVNPIPGAETLNAALRRFHTDLIAIGERHQGKKVAVFSHGRIIRTLVHDIIDQDVQHLPNCGVIQVVYLPNSPEKPFKYDAEETI